MASTSTVRCSGRRAPSGSSRRARARSAPPATSPQPADPNAANPGFLTPYTAPRARGSWSPPIPRAGSAVYDAANPGFVASGEGGDPGGGCRDDPVEDRVVRRACAFRNLEGVIAVVDDLHGSIRDRPCDLFDQWWG